MSSIRGSLVLVSLAVSLAVGGCSPEGGQGEGKGGTTGAAGTTGAGGTTGAAGTTGAGGTTSAGGTTGTAGTVGYGGTTGIAGTTGKGGTTGSGGSTAAGGSGPGAGGSSTGGTGGGAAGGTGGGSTGTCPVVTDFDTWPSGKSPADVGKAVVGAFLPRTQDVYGPSGDAGDGYAWTFGYFGSLQFTKTSGDTTTNAKLLSDYTKAIGARPLPANPPPDGSNQVDRRAFGDLPLEVFLQTQDAAAKKLGMDRADVQWSVTSSDGITRDARYWADDMFMITGLQVYAYRATKDKKYLDRAVLAMKAYFAKLQQADGLFNHTQQSKAYWGRANGWVAVGMAELLLELPLGADRDAIMAGYKKQMDALVKYQITSGNDPGAWNQVVDVTTLKPEMSCTAMFTFALATGVKNGWLTDPKYAAAARNGWLALGKRTSSGGQLDLVCPGTGQADAGSLASQQQFYMSIAFSANDNHGQAALIWAANALLRKDCPGVR
jgi:rhamnogalacturonyl hydrolase YesR